MSQACRRFWKCDKTLAFRSLSRRCAIPCSCHAKRHLNVQKWSEPLVFLTFWLRNVLRATTACTFSVSQLPKVVRSWCVLWSEHVVFCTFWLRHVLRGTTACTFSTSQLPKVVRTCGVLWILTSKCASCRKGVRFWTSQLPKVLQTCGIFLTFWLRHVLRATKACNFSSLISTDGSAPAALASLLFDPPEPQIIGKTQWIVTFLPFRAPSSSFFWLFLFFDLLSSTPLFSLTLPISAFHLSILSEVWLLNFLRLYYIIEGSLEVKLPTIWTDEKQSRAEAERRERSEERRVEEKE